MSVYADDMFFFVEKFAMYITFIHACQHIAAYMLKYVHSAKTIFRIHVLYSLFCA